jgi:hypothetical protein
MFRRPKSTDAEFCDRCGSVCDARCRALAIREQALTRAVASRIGF